MPIFNFQHGSVQRDVNTDLGDPFILSISFDPILFQFGFIFDKEELDPLVIKSREFFTLENVNVSGALSVNYLGFTKSGHSP